MVRSQGFPVALCPGTLYVEVRGGGEKKKDRGEWGVGRAITARTKHM